MHFKTNLKMKICVNNEKIYFANNQLIISIIKEKNIKYKQLFKTLSALSEKTLSVSKIIFSV